MSKPQIHIYTLSRLVFADVTDWQKILKDLRKGRTNMFWSYKPVREAAFEMASQKDADRESIYANAGTSAQKAGGERCRKANLAALQKFEDTFLQQIGKAKSNFMQGGNPPVDFGEVQLLGGPHFSIATVDGSEKFVYLHPSNWTDEETTAFCELLTVVVENKFNATAKDIWFLDLRTGVRMPWNSSKKLVRRKCEKAAAFLIALQETNLIEDES